MPICIIALAVVKSQVRSYRYADLKSLFCFLFGVFFFYSFNLMATVEFGSEEHYHCRLASPRLASRVLISTLLQFFLLDQRCGSWAFLEPIPFGCRWWMSISS